MTLPLSLRIVEAELRIYRRTWRGSVFSSFLNPILYLLAMGVGLGTLVDANLPRGLSGLTYVTYLAPGLLVATAMQTGAGEGSWKVMAGIKWQSTWNARLATPIGIPSLAVGHLLWAFLRVLMVSVSFVVVMIAFDVTTPLQSIGALVPALLVGMAMAAMTTAFTSRLEEQAGLPMFFRFVVIPMFLFSGVFFPITQLPGWLQPVAYITPVFHGVELARDIALGVAPMVDPWISVAYLMAWTVIGGILIVPPLRKRLTP
jgi:lipooligosaccharide transport system permease protein